jgi:hypothetical protein
MLKFKNQAGFSDGIIMLIISSIIAILFITGVFLWREVNTHKTLGGFLSSLRNNTTIEASEIIDSFETCVAAGRPVLEPYPRQCIYIDGQVFIEDLGDLVVDVYEPKAGDIVESPLAVRGQAKGTWFFEGDFPIILTDENGQELAVAIATADGEWMTEDLVDFEAEIIFEKPDASIGFLIFEKDNPSDLPANDASISIPILFK